MTEDNIVRGYQGIIDLDLSGIDSKYKEDAIRQHLQDIEEYKIEQSKLPERLRYKNTIIPALKIIKNDQYAANRHSRHLEFLQNQRDINRFELYKRVSEMKKYEK